METTTPLCQLSRLRTYSSLAIGATALLGAHSEAATIIDVNAATFETTFSSIGTVGTKAVITGAYESRYVTFSEPVYISNKGFYRGTDAATVARSFFQVNDFAYFSKFSSYPPDSANNAERGSDNWLPVSGGSDDSQQLWLQFDFGFDEGNSFSIVKAVYPDYEGELLSAFDAANAVPEPSALALLALGASGLLVRRRRQAA